MVLPACAAAHADCPAIQNLTAKGQEPRDLLKNAWFLSFQVFRPLQGILAQGFAEEQALFGAYRCPARRQAFRSGL